MEPVIKPQGPPIDPDMIEVKCKTEIGCEPVDLVAIEVFEIHHGGPEIGCSYGYNQCIVDCVDSIIGILKLVSLEEGVHKDKNLKEGGCKDERD